MRAVKETGRPRGRSPHLGVGASQTLHVAAWLLLPSPTRHGPSGAASAQVQTGTAGVPRPRMGGGAELPELIEPGGGLA